MRRVLLPALIMSIAVPTAAQEASSTPAPAMSPQQITAFNQAVADFKLGQQAQQGGDNAGALAKYEAALPAIREAVRVQPTNLDMVSFLANALNVTAAANAGLQKMDAVIPLYEESVPLWRKVTEAKPDDLPSKMVLASILTQLGNVKLSKQDKVGAAPYYTESIPLARQAVAEKPDGQSKNLLLSALIGGSQASDDAAIRTEVTTMSKAMLADGSVAAANKPAAQVYAGTSSAE